MNAIERISAAQALSATTEAITAVTSLAFMAGYTRATFVQLDFSTLTAFADTYRLPRLLALMAQIQLRGKSEPIDPRALQAIGALES